MPTARVPVSQNHQGEKYPRRTEATKFASKANARSEAIVKQNTPAAAAARFMIISLRPTDYLTSRTLAYTSEGNNESLYLVIA